MIGPSRRPTLADVEGRVAVQAEDPLDAVERAQLDQRQRAAGHHLLGGLEEQPDPARRAAPARATRPSAIAAPTSAVVCTSWPQAWVTPSTRAGPRVLGQVGDRAARRGRRAAPIDRAGVADLGDQTGPRQLGDPPAGAAGSGRRPARSCGPRARTARGGRAGPGAARPARRRTRRRRRRSATRSGWARPRTSRSRLVHRSSARRPAARSSTGPGRSSGARAPCLAASAALDRAGGTQHLPGRRGAPVVSGRSR